jgi:hypothetical protein
LQLGGVAHRAVVSVLGFLFGLVFVQLAIVKFDGVHLVFGKGFQEVCVHDLLSHPYVRMSREIASLQATKTP